MMATNLPTTSSYGPGAEWPMLALTLPATDALAVSLSLPASAPHPSLPALTPIHSNYYDYQQRPMYYAGLAPYMLMGVYGFGTQELQFATVAKLATVDGGHGIPSGIASGLASAGSGGHPAASAGAIAALVSIPLAPQGPQGYSGTTSSWSPMAPPPQHQQHQRPQHIDYLSLVLFTLLPLLKRKRRRNDARVAEAAPEVGAGDSQFPCPVCNKVFQKPYNLKLHMKTHSPDKPFKCLKCPKTFARGHDKRRHEQLHDGVKNFTCQGYLNDGVTKWGCGKKFARLDALARHFRTETGWMCILPLMDEAKRSQNGAVDDHTMIKRIIAER